jgi:hypothetical protein
MTQSQSAIVADQAKHQVSDAPITPQHDWHPDMSRERPEWKAEHLKQKDAKFPIDENGIYIVQKGDTLFDIAIRSLKETKKSTNAAAIISKVNEIVRLNIDSNPSLKESSPLIHPGDRLKVAENSATAVLSDPSQSTEQAVPAPPQVVELPTIILPTPTIDVPAVPGPGTATAYPLHQPEQAYAPDALPATEPGIYAQPTADSLDPIADVIVGDLPWQRQRGVDFNDDRYRTWSNREQVGESRWNSYMPLTADGQPIHRPTAVVHMPRILTPAVPPQAHHHEITNIAKSSAVYVDSSTKRQESVRDKSFWMQQADAAKRLQAESTKATVQQFKQLVAHASAAQQLQYAVR